MHLTFWHWHHCLFTVKIIQFWKRWKQNTNSTWKINQISIPTNIRFVTIGYFVLYNLTTWLYIVHALMCLFCVFPSHFVCLSSFANNGQFKRLVLSQHFGKHTLVFPQWEMGDANGNNNNNNNNHLFCFRLLAKALAKKGMNLRKNYMVFCRILFTLLIASNRKFGLTFYMHFTFLQTKIPSQIPLFFITRKTLNWHLFILKERTN